MWRPRESGYTPKRGDLVIFTNGNNSASHIGIAETTNVSYITTIEGNRDNAVSRPLYRPTTTSVLGFCAVQYYSEEDAAKAKEAAREQSVKTALDKLVSAGVVNSPDYWMKNYKELLYLDELIIKCSTLVK